MLQDLPAHHTRDLGLFRLGTAFRPWKTFIFGWRLLFEPRSREKTLAPTQSVPPGTAKIQNKKRASVQLPDARHWVVEYSG